MKLKDMVKWNTRVSALYALGIWTMISSYTYYRYTGQYDETLPGKKEKPPEKEKNPYEVVHETPLSKTVIIYKKDFVPYTTRISNFITSFSSPPGHK
ncbi:small integral membrane protein 26-like [Nelusetta ayraudi]|uniref:small integral membrane protein 26-like n=1 Tax=Nelusetta ayraudi TaxID=303726 RepID=UPI003F714B48